MSLAFYSAKEENKNAKSYGHIFLLILITWSDDINSVKQGWNHYQILIFLLHKKTYNQELLVQFFEWYT